MPTLCLPHFTTSYTATGQGEKVDCCITALCILLYYSVMKCSQPHFTEHHCTHSVQSKVMHCPIYSKLLCCTASSSTELQYIPLHCMVHYVTKMCRTALQCTAWYTKSLKCVGLHYAALHTTPLHWKQDFQKSRVSTTASLGTVYPS